MWLTGSQGTVQLHAHAQTIGGAIRPIPALRAHDQRRWLRRPPPLEAAGIEMGQGCAPTNSFSGARRRFQELLHLVLYCRLGLAAEPYHVLASSFARAVDRYSCYSCSSSGGRGKVCAGVNSESLRNVGGCIRRALLQVCARAHVQCMRWSWGGGSPPLGGRALPRDGVHKGYHRVNISVGDSVSTWSVENQAPFMGGWVFMQ